MKIFRLEFGFHRKHNRKVLSRYWRPRRLTQEGEPKIFKWRWFYFGSAPKYKFITYCDSDCTQYLCVKSHSLRMLRSIGADFDKQKLSWSIERSGNIINFGMTQEKSLAPFCLKEKRETKK